VSKIQYCNIDVQRRPDQVHRSNIYRRLFDLKMISYNENTLMNLDIIRN